MNTGKGEHPPLRPPRSTLSGKEQPTAPFNERWPLFESAKSHSKPKKKSKKKTEIRRVPGLRSQRMGLRPPSDFVFFENSIFLHVC